MHVAGRRTGLLVWRLIEARKRSEPKELTGKIRKQVVKDLKTVAGFARAQAAAKALVAGLPDGDFEKLTKAADARYRNTEMMPRQTIDMWFRADQGVIGMVQGIRYLMASGNTKADAPEIQRAMGQLRYADGMLRQQMTYQPDFRILTPTTFLDFDPDMRASRDDAREANDLLIAEAFKLAPADPSEAPTDKPVTIVSLPRVKRVVVMQRVGYDLASETDFETEFLRQMPVLTAASRRQQSMNEWFKLENIIARTGYKQETDAPAETPKVTTDQPKSDD